MQFLPYCRALEEVLVARLEEDLALLQPLRIRLGAGPERGSPPRGGTPPRSHVQSGRVALGVPPRGPPKSTVLGSRCLHRLRGPLNPLSLLKK